MNHGTRTCYVHHKCRCDLCKAAQAEYQRKVYAENGYNQNRKRINRLSRLKVAAAAKWVRENRPDVWQQISDSVK